MIKNKNMPKTHHLFSEELLPHEMADQAEKKRRIKWLLLAVSVAFEVGDRAKTVTSRHSR